MPSRTRPALFAMLGILVALGGGSAGTAGADEWPPVRKGTWELQGTRTLPGGKVKSWTETSRQCEDPSWLFKGYWGTGIVERQGCRFEGTRLSPTSFKVAAECMVRGAGRTRSESTVALEGDQTFEMRIKLVERRKTTELVQKGRWLRGCEDPS